MRFNRGVLGKTEPPRYRGDMPRYALKIEYNGAGFVGWQRQDSLPSVQGAIETALRQLEPENAGIMGAGRTDTGVHALGQVAHTDLEKDWEPFRLFEALNYHLRGHAVSIVNAARVSEEFHARFSAVERQYRYRLLFRRAPTVFDAGHVWQLGYRLDAGAMHEAAQHLLGQHDFTTFRSSMCQAKSPVKTLDQLDVTEHPFKDGSEYRFTVRARSFLHNQVRSFVGTLERVGAGKWTPDDVKSALEAADRSRCGPVAPPQGLYLEHVRYPEEVFTDVMLP